MTRVDNRLFELVTGESKMNFQNLENFLAESFLRVDDRAACCAMRPGESVKLGVSELRRLS